METYNVLRDLAIIIVAAKLCGLLARRLKAPQVVGEIIAGIIIGPSLLGWVDQTDFLLQMAEIGVIMLMFSAGLGTNLKDLKKTGLKATLIACAGVLIPFIGGTILYMAFYGVPSTDTEGLYKGLFIGCIMTATSVSITVQALREMGHLKGFVGTTILSAAIIDDIIGIIVLTFVLGLKDPSAKPVSVIINTLLFFVFAVVVGVIFYKIFKWVDAKYPHTRRIPIAGLALCFGMAYVSEHFFGIADITGAYLAGIILCNIGDSDYIEEKMDINSYMLFGPVFFASIGLKTTINSVTGSLIVFSLLFVVVALITKIIGCGLMAKLCKFKNHDALKIGLGMMTRGEVALIVSQKGLDAGMMTPEYFTAVILLIIFSSILTPIFLKLVYSKYPDHNYTDTVNA